jgi:hypothetical protein
MCTSNRRLKLLERPDLLERYRQGLLTLHQVAAAATSDETGSAGTNQQEPEMLERGDLETVSQGNSDDQEHSPAARRYHLWRPYRNTVRRWQQTRVADLADDDKAELRRIVDETQAELDRLREELGD